MKLFFRKTIKYILYSLAGITAFALIYFLLAFILSSITVNKEPQQTKQDVYIYILTNGVHSDIVVPVKNRQKNWSKEIKFESTYSKDTLMQYIAFGWGDKGFYLETPQWSDLKFSTAFKAAFYLGHSAMHATFYKKMNESDRCIKIGVRSDQYEKLIAYIENSFEKDRDGKVILIPNKGYGANDAFYEAKGSYGLFNTCNTWTNSGLKYSSLKACLWTPFDKGIFKQYSAK